MHSLPAVSPSDRRHYPRLHAPIYYRAARAKLPFPPRRVIDAGIGGVRIYSDDALAPGTELELELFLDGGESIEFTGEVAWVHPLETGEPARFDVGVRFTHVTDHALARMGAALGPVALAP